MTTSYVQSEYFDREKKLFLAGGVSSEQMCSGLL